MSLSNFASTQQGGSGTVTTTTILDGTIANADVASDAAIAVSKIDFGNTLEIETSSGDQIFEMDNNAANSSNFQINNGAGNARTDLYLDGSAIITLKNQMVGIGDTSPSYALDVNSTGRFTTDLIVGGNLTVGDGGAEDQKVVFDGNALDFHVALDDSADDLVIGTGSTAGSNTLVSINGDGTETIFAQPKVTIGDATAEDTMLAFDGNALDFHISLDDSADDLVIGTGTTAGSNTLVSINGDATGIELKVPTVTVGDGTAEDTQVKFDGNALDFHVGLDDSADDLVIGTGSTLGTNTIVSINGDATGIELKVPTVTVGDGTAEDTMVAFDGNALDFHISLDDSADDLVIGTGTTAGSNTLISVNGDGSETKFNQPKITIGDATAEDTYIIFDGNAQDFRIGLDDGTDTLEIGGGSAHGTAAGISMDVNGDMTLGGGIACADEVIGRPRFTDYAETLNALGDTGGGTDAIDITAGNVVSATVSTGTQTFTFTNPSATGKSCSFTLILTNGGSQTVNWPAAVDWAGGSAPSLTSSGIDILTFTTIDAGTIWYGFAAGADMG